ncbi:ATP-binding protein [Luteipulveratus flavus]|uniref:Histidine kinase/HSP90-like ATPase domain-containing protein n=1 Tax=Luteipulveratus flavus TaxID=3031728 RepID=A0ABT6C2E6_9MICO|nr:ATP-binding protein [Luteipulveratus sp. YIM 133296]MDF8263101.1 hypothetical protein [Luteipulveratus sp. YIM 133296]
MALQERSRSWSDTFELSVRALSILLTVGNTVSGSAMLLQQGLPRTNSARGVVGLLLLDALLLSAALAVERAGPLMVCSATAVGATGVVLLPLADAQQPSGGSWVYPWMLVPVVALAVVLPSRQCMGASAALACAYGLASLLNAGPSWKAAEVAATDGGFLLVIPATLTWAMKGIRRVLRSYDALLQDRRTRHRHELELRTATAQRREVDRIVHDHVLQALKVLTLPTGSVPASEVRALCRRACAVFREELEGVPDSGPVALAPQLRAAARDLGLAVTLTGVPAWVPAEVAHAIGSATREALSNTRRHAYVDEAWVTTTRSGTTITVEVTDHGEGFDDTGAGLGVRLSMNERMRDIGGTCEVVSSPSRGCRVRLTWSPEVDSVPRATRLAFIDGLSSAFVLSATPTVAMAVWFSWWKSPLLADPALPVLATILGALLWLAVATRLLRPGRLTGPTSIAGWSAVVAAWVDGSALPPGFSDGGLYWLAGGLCPLVLAVIFFRPLRESVPPALALVVVVAFWLCEAGGGPSAIAAQASVLAAPALPILCAYILRILCDRIQGRAEIEEERILRVSARTTRLRVKEADLRERAEYLRLEVLPLCDAVARGAQPLSGVAVAARAAALEGEVRDTLELGRPVHQEVRRALWRLRSGGWRVQLRLDAGLPSAHRLGTLLGYVPPHSGSTVTIRTTTAAGGERLTVTVIPGSETLRRAARAMLGVEVVHDADSTQCIIAPPPDAPSSPTCPDDVRHYQEVPPCPTALLRGETSESARSTTIL